MLKTINALMPDLLEDVRNPREHLAASTPAVVPKE
jgi:hypothetical protein